MDPKASRGFLNNNPGNLDRSADTWQGEIKDAGDARLTDFQRIELQHGRFCVFVEPEWGYRAMAKNLFAYRDRLGRRTIRALISQWAPPAENDTSAYVATVADELGVSADEPVNLNDYATLAAVCDAISRVECGGMPYGGHELEDGLRLAGVVKPVTVGTSKTAKAGAIASAATVGEVATNAVQAPLQQAIDTLTPMMGVNAMIDTIIVCLKIVLAIAALSGIGWMIWERIKRERRDEKIEVAPAVAGPEPQIVQRGTFALAEP